VSTNERIEEVALYAQEFGLQEASTHFNISIDSIKRYIRRYREITEDDDFEIKSNGLGEIEVDGNNATFTGRTRHDIKTLDELIEAFDVDTDVWIVNSYRINKWDAMAGEGKKMPMYQVKASLTRRKPENPEWPILQPITIDENFLPISHHENQPTQKHLIMSDLHVGFNLVNGEKQPYHLPKLMSNIIELVQEEKFDTIILNGDMLDMAQLSKYTQMPEFVGMLQPAINTLGSWMYDIRKVSPDSRIVFVSGNHESKRLIHQIVENMQWAYGLKAFGDDTPFLTIPNLLGLDKMGVEYAGDYPKGEVWLNNRLRVYHGEYTSNTKELSTANVSTIFGHVHQISTICKTVRGRFGAESIEIHTSGCMCHMDGRVPGKHNPNWQQGFIIVDTHWDDFSVQHVRVKDEGFIYNSQKY
jgi:predicted phosphodiesterase/transposase